MPPQYKFVELSVVTDESIEICVNEWVGRGWQLDGIRFVTTDHSKRPSMAFVSFIREPLRVVKDKPSEPAGEPAVITAAHGTDVD